MALLSTLKTKIFHVVLMFLSQLQKSTIVISLNIQKKKKRNKTSKVLKAITYRYLKKKEKSNTFSGYNN